LKHINFPTQCTETDILANNVFFRYIIIDNIVSYRYIYSMS
jgi:hypothetical protein